jgi:CDP-diacylglycerol--glycerol-3-phosphate 3-phosphatidyltransferase
MVSYTKARAEGLGLECRTGILARPERVIILAIGLLSGTGICLWALVLLAVFSHVTAVERMISVWRSTHQIAERPASVVPQQDASEHNHRLPTSGTNERHDTTVRPVPTRILPFNGRVRNK